MAAVTPLAAALAAGARRTPFVTIEVDYTVSDVGAEAHMHQVHGDWRDAEGKFEPQQKPASPCASDVHPAVDGDAEPLAASAACTHASLADHLASAFITGRRSQLEGPQEASLPDLGMDDQETGSGIAVRLQSIPMQGDAQDGPLGRAVSVHVERALHLHPRFAALDKSGAALCVRTESGAATQAVHAQMSPTQGATASWETELRAQLTCSTDTAAALADHLRLLVVRDWCQLHAFCCNGACIAPQDWSRLYDMPQLPECTCSESLDTGMH
jgi:hypothetical protein